MEQDYTEPQLLACFLQAYPNSIMITNSFAVQDCYTAVCGHYAAPVAVCRRRGLCRGDFGQLARLVRHLWEHFETKAVILRGLIEHEQIINRSSNRRMKQLVDWLSNPH